MAPRPSEHVEVNRTWNKSRSPYASPTANPSWLSAVLPPPHTYFGHALVLRHNTFLNVVEPDQEHPMKRCASTPELTRGLSSSFPSIAAAPVDTVKGIHTSPPLKETDCTSSTGSTTSASTNSKYAKRLANSQEDCDSELRSLDTSDSEADEEDEEYDGNMISPQWQQPAGLQIGVDAEALLKLVPRDEAGTPMSIGSVNHGTSDCKACLFMHTKTGCNNGVACEFCHFLHKRSRRKNKLRPCKGKRDRYRKAVERIENAIADGPEALDREFDRLPPSIAQNELLKEKLIKKVQMKVGARGM